MNEATKKVIRTVKLPALPEQSLQERAKYSARLLWIHGFLTEAEMQRVGARIRARVVQAPTPHTIDSAVKNND